LKALINEIQLADRIVLSTHREPDGDGIGSQVGLYYALKKIGKDVRILNVDRIPKKYEFLNEESIIQSFETPHDQLEDSDLAIILDINDSRLIQPLYYDLEHLCEKIVFVDHHPVLQSGPELTKHSLIDTDAASTGELVFKIIRELGIDLDTKIARALYTSVAFDTQTFRFIRNSPNSHLIAAELLKFEKNPEEVHQYLFGSYTAEKVAFLSKVLRDIEFYHEKQIAYLSISQNDLKEYGLHIDETRDLVDMIMAIESLQAAVFVRDNGDNSYKFSFRSKGCVEFLSIAESVGGGGHPYAAGALVIGSIDKVKRRILDQILGQLKAAKDGTYK
jgi:phosphoesterase RecJ-like protein